MAGRSAREFPSAAVAGAAGEQLGKLRVRAPAEQAQAQAQVPMPMPKLGARVRLSAAGDATKRPG